MAQPSLLRPTLILDVSVGGGGGLNAIRPQGWVYKFCNWGSPHAGACLAYHDILIDEAGAPFSPLKWHAGIELWPQAGHDSMSGISQVRKKKERKNKLKKKKGWSVQAIGWVM